MQAILVLEMPTGHEVRASLRWDLPDHPDHEQVDRRWGLAQNGAPPRWTPELVAQADRAARALLEATELQRVGETRLYRRPSTPQLVQVRGPSRGPSNRPPVERIA